MSFLRDFIARAKPRAALRDERGVAAVEFAMVSTFLFAAVSGAVDVSNAWTVSRDLHRFTAEAAQTMIHACKGNQTCVTLTSQSLGIRIANILPGLTGVQVGAAGIERVNNVVTATGGTMTHLPADMNADAMATLANGDSGIAVLVSYTHRPIILSFAQQWGFTVKNFRYYTVALRSKPNPT